MADRVRHQGGELTSEEVNVWEYVYLKATH